MKKHFLLLLCACLAAALAGCTGAAGQASAVPQYEELTVIGFSQVGAESDWRAANTKSMQEAFSEENGYKLIFDDAQQKQARQITAIRNFIQQEVDYIILAPTTETGWDTVLQEARDAGIPVIIVDRMIEVQDEALFTCWIGSDFQKQGEIATAWLGQHFGEQPVNIVHLQGSMGSTAQLGRTAALDAAIASHPNWALLGRQGGEFTQAKGQEVMESFLRDNLDFNVVYSENDNMTYGAVDALNAAGRKPGEDVIVVSFDANRRALDMTLDGIISCEVECNPLHGPRVQAVLQQLEAGETPQKFTFVEETVFYASSMTQAVIDARVY